MLADHEIARIESQLDATDDASTLRGHIRELLDDRRARRGRLSVWQAIWPALHPEAVRRGLSLATRILRSASLLGHLLLDLAVFRVAWQALWWIHHVIEKHPIPGWAAGWVLTLHQWTVLLSFAVLFAAMAWDIIKAAQEDK